MRSCSNPAAIAVRQFSSLGSETAWERNGTNARQIISATEYVCSFKSVFHPLRLFIILVNSLLQRNCGDSIRNLKCTLELPNYPG